MKPVRTIQFNTASLDQLLSNLYGYWIEIAQKQDISREELYRLYLIKKFYERSRKRHENMIAESRKTIRIKFDIAHAVLMVDVLQRTMATKTTLDVLYQLGSFCPPQMQKV